MEAYLGDIRMFAGLYAPEYWNLCDGTLLNINDSGYTQQLFSLIGTTYGGDGVKTFALPDLRGRVPIGAGSGVNLTPRVIGQKGGAETVSVTVAQLPTHSHAVYASPQAASSLSPAGLYLANTSAITAMGPPPQRKAGTPVSIYQTPPYSDSTPLGTQAVSSAGGGQPHLNVMPSFCVNFIICVQGLYPVPADSN